MPRASAVGFAGPQRFIINVLYNWKGSFLRSENVLGFVWLLGGFSRNDLLPERIGSYGFQLRVLWRQEAMWYLGCLIVS